MNTENQHDQKWQALLTRSAQTFEAAEPSYGFMTSTLARLRAEAGERELVERIGLRALFASAAILVAVGGFSVGVQLQNGIDLEPGMRGIIQADDVPIA